VEVEGYAKKGGRVVERVQAERLRALREVKGQIVSIRPDGMSQYRERDGERGRGRVREIVRAQTDRSDAESERESRSSQIS
jgi:hypothetical protein